MNGQGHGCPHNIHMVAGSSLTGLQVCPPLPCLPRQALRSRLRCQPHSRHEGGYPPHRGGPPRKHCTRPSRHRHSCMTRTSGTRDVLTLRHLGLPQASEAERTPLNHTDTLGTETHNPRPSAHSVGRTHRWARLAPATHRRSPPTGPLAKRVQGLLRRESAPLGVGVSGVHCTLQGGNTSESYVLYRFSWWELAELHPCSHRAAPGSEGGGRQFDLALLRGRGQGLTCWVAAMAAAVRCGEAGL